MPLQLPQSPHAAKSYPINPYYPKANSDNRHKGSYHYKWSGSDVVLSQPPNKGHFNSDQSSENQLEPPDFFLNLVAGSKLRQDRKSTRLNSSHLGISYAVFCLKKKINTY